MVFQNHDEDKRAGWDQMMDDLFDAHSLPDVVRLFPLEDVILFPHTVLPLHIFEPRYRQMTDDALASDRLIAMVRVRPGAAISSAGPVTEHVACLGEIVRHTRLPDGRSKLLLAGRRRVRLQREIASDRLYRIAAFEVLEDEYGSEAEDHRRAEFLALMQAFLAERHAEDGDLVRLLKSTLPVGALTDIIAPVLGLSADLLQTLLNESRVARRLDVLVDVLRQRQAATNQEAGVSRPFPPRFSSN